MPLKLGMTQLLLKTSLNIQSCLTSCTNYIYSNNKHRRYIFRQMGITYNIDGKYFLITAFNNLKSKNTYNRLMKCELQIHFESLVCDYLKFCLNQLTIVDLLLWNSDI